jgi:hypothetical protein
VTLPFVFGRRIRDSRTPPVGHGNGYNELCYGPTLGATASGAQPLGVRSSRAATAGMGLTANLLLCVRAHEYGAGPGPHKTSPLGGAAAELLTSPGSRIGGVAQLVEQGTFKGLPYFSLLSVPVRGYPAVPAASPLGVRLSPLRSTKITLDCPQNCHQSSVRFVQHPAASSQPGVGVSQVGRDTYWESTPELRSSGLRQDALHSKGTRRGILLRLPLKE